MKIKRNFLIIIISIIFISAIFPDTWQIGIAGVTSFFIAYLITKINNHQQEKNNNFK